MRNLSHRLQGVHDDAGWAMENLSLSDNGETLAAAIRGKYEIAISDGSFGMDTETLAFLI